jgi:hypothetical protein
MKAGWLLLLRSLWRGGCSGRSVLVVALVLLFYDRCKGHLASALAAVPLRALPETLPAPMRPTFRLGLQLWGCGGWIAQQGCSAAGLRHILGLLHLRAVGGRRRSLVVALLPIRSINWSRLLASGIPQHLALEHVLYPLPTGHAQPLGRIGWMPAPLNPTIAPAAAGV